MNNYTKELHERAEYGGEFIRKEAVRRLLGECHEWPVDYLTRNIREEIREKYVVRDTV